MKTIAFFSKAAGVGQSTLIYHLAHMLAEQGHQTLIVDLDPQSSLTAMCRPEEELERLWPDSGAPPLTILGCVQPLIDDTGDVAPARVQPLHANLGLIAGDLGLSAFEGRLSRAWGRALGHDGAALGTLSAFYRVILHAAREREAALALIDVGPNLGAISQAALLAADHIVMPLAPDMFSIKGLRSVGPMLQAWRATWQARSARNPSPELELPPGTMDSLGYVVMQAKMRLSRPVRSYQRWVGRLPDQFHRWVLHRSEPVPSADDDPWCLGIMRHYQSLMPLAQSALKPMFQLRPADGAIGAHMDAVRRCRAEFVALADQVRSRAAPP